MIGRMKGIILAKEPPFLLLDVHGIGYEITAPLSTFQQLPALHQEVTLHTHLVVREDAHQLYGFFQESDRRLFRALIKVNGVGPKLALTILSGIETKQFIQCVTQQDVSALIGIPGIGRKTAERLIVETKDVLIGWTTHDDTLALENETDQTQDAIRALIALGYPPKAAKQAILSIKTPNHSTEELIRSALKQMMAGV